MVDVQDVETNPPSTGAEKKRKHDREKDEEQFILRLPDPLCNEMRLGLASKAKRDAAGSEAKFSIHFVSDREAFFHLNDKRYAATLYDLPALVETHKTADKRTYYKSADVHQVLVVRLPELPPQTETPTVPPLPPPPAPPLQPAPPQPFMLNDGVSPASRGAAHRFHTPAPSLASEELNDVERGIKYVIDHKLSFVRKQEAEEEPDEVKIEVDADPPAEATSGSNLPTAEQSVAAAPSSAVPSTPLSAAATPSPAPATPLDVATPAPAEDTPMEDDPDDLDDFAAMLGDEIMEDTNDDTKQRLEKTRLDSKIDDQKALIKSKQDEAANVPNPMLRKRMLGKIEPLEKVLKELEEERKKLG